MESKRMDIKILWKEAKLLSFKIQLAQLNSGVGGSSNTSFAAPTDCKSNAGPSTTNFSSATWLFPSPPFKLSTNILLLPFSSLFNKLELSIVFFLKTYCCLSCTITCILNICSIFTDAVHVHPSTFPSRTFKIAALLQLHRSYHQTSLVEHISWQMCHPLQRLHSSMHDMCTLL